MSGQIVLEVFGLIADAHPMPVTDDDVARVRFRLTYSVDRPFDVRMDVDESGEGWVFDRALLCLGMGSVPGSDAVHGSGPVRVGRTLSGLAFQLFGDGRERIAVLDPVPVRTFLTALEAAELPDVDSWGVT